MKKIISTLLISTSLVVSPALACSDCLQDQLTALTKIFSKGEAKGLAHLNKKGTGVKVKNAKHEYVVCYGYENEGKDIVRLASSKGVLPKAKVTEDKEVTDMVKNLFEHADGKTLVKFAHNKAEYQAKAVDMHMLDEKVEAGKSVCAAVELAKHDAAPAAEHAKEVKAEHAEHAKEEVKAEHAEHAKEEVKAEHAVEAVPAEAPAAAAPAAEAK